MVIDGKKIAARILGELKAWPKPEKFLAAVLVGADPASVSFLKQKEKAAKEVGVEFRLFKFDAGIGTSELVQKVKEIVESPDCAGLIVQLPLPAGIETRTVLDAVPAEKDPDVLSAKSLEKFSSGASSILPPSEGEPRLEGGPPAVGTVVEILREVEKIEPDYKLENLKVAVVGRGELVGKPISEWLESKVKKLILLRRGSDFSILKEMDLIISGTGQAGLIKPEMLKDGAGVIDFGYSEEAGRLAGDLAADSPEITRLKFYTATPGGTGPILVAKLLENLFRLLVY